MKTIALLIFVAALSGCAHVKFADGTRVAIEHDPTEDPVILAQLLEQANEACIKSGGKAPAQRVSYLPAHNMLPASWLRHTSTYRCKE